MTVMITVTDCVDVHRAAEAGSTGGGKPSTISWRSDVQDNSCRGPDSSSAMKGGGNTGGARRKWSIRSRRSSGSGGRGGSSAFLGHGLEDDDLDCDLFDDELDFRHQHDDTTSVYLTNHHNDRLPILNFSAFIHIITSAEERRRLCDRICICVRWITQNSYKRTNGLYN